MVLIQFPPKSFSWISSLRSHKRWGLTFSPNTFLDKSLLGFTNLSNSLGFKGTDKESDNVILGTSFALGVGVDEGFNWYNNNKFDSYFNLSFPVGNDNHLNKLKDLVISGNRLIYLYHPNMLVTSFIFNQAENANKTIFEFMKWKESGSIIFYIKYYTKFIAKLFKGRIFIGFHNKKPYLLDNEYCYFPVKEHSEFLKRELQILESIFRMFKKVYFVRVPIREELSKKTHNILKKDIIFNFNAVINHISKLKNIKLIDSTPIFSLDDYHQFDNHWNVNGNQKFARFLLRAIND